MNRTALILKRDGVGRVRIIPVEKRWMAVEEFQRSGLSARKFAQLIGVHYNMFWNWLHGQGMTANGGATVKPTPWLVEVCVDAGRAGSASLPSALQIGLPGGARLVITDAAQVVLAAKLIQALA